MAPVTKVYVGISGPKGEAGEHGPQGPPGDLSQAVADTLYADKDETATALDTKIEGGAVDDEDVAFTLIDQQHRRGPFEISATGGLTAHSRQKIAEALERVVAETAQLPGILREIPDELVTASGWVFAVTDTQDHISFGVRTDGSVYPADSEPEPETVLASMETLLGTDRALLVREPNGTTRPYTSTPARVAFWGDSLVAGYPVPPFAADGSDSLAGVFATLHPDGTVLNGGYSGKTADEIAIWQGGLVIAVVPEGGELPASGTVNVTTAQAPRWRLDSPSGFSVAGTVAGVAGQLTRTSATTFDFTRDDVGDAVPVPDPVPFLATVGDGYADGIAVVLMGRNDVSYFGAEPDLVDRVVVATAAIVESLTPRYPRVLLLGTTNSTGEPTGSAGHTSVTTINAALAARYPGFFFDYRSWLVNEAIYAMGLTPTSDDLGDIAADTIPGSLMHDSVHYTPATAAAAARRIHDELTTRGWI